MAGEVEKSDEDLRQEGREEILEWLRQREIVNYSTRDGKYFIWNRHSELLLILPWEPKGLN
jgi:hypothetical protein